MIISYLISLSGIWFWKVGWDAALLLITIGWLACIESSPLRSVRKQWNRTAVATAQWSVYLYVILYDYKASDGWQQLACAIMVTIFSYVQGKKETNPKHRDIRLEKIWVPWVAPIALFYVWNYWVTSMQPVTNLMLYGIVMLGVYSWYQMPREKIYFWISQLGVWCFLSGYTAKGSEWVLLIVVGMVLLMRKWGWRYIV